MDLASFATTYLGTETGGTLHGVGPASDRLYKIVRSETHTDPLIATLFWQIVIHTPSYVRTLQRAGASPESVRRAETIVVSHGEGFSPRYDLVVFDPAYGKSKPTGLPMEVPREELVEGWKRWQNRRIAQRKNFNLSNADSDSEMRFIQLVENVDAQLAIEAAKAKPFGILVTRPPVIRHTSVPSPPWGVASSAGGKPTSTAGTTARDSQGRTGVTIAFHAIRDTHATVSSAVTDVEINGITGTIQGTDWMSDSCFVEMPLVASVDQHRGKRGPLSGVSPRSSEHVQFEGITSGLRSAKVTGWNADIPFVHPDSQLKVITTAVTEPGDSGAALVNGDDHILGFSFIRTGLAVDPATELEFSAWIWADSVYKFHKLREL